MSIFSVAYKFDEKKAFKLTFDWVFEQIEYTISE